MLWGWLSNICKWCCTVHGADPHVDTIIVFIRWPCKKWARKAGRLVGLRKNFLRVPHVGQVEEGHHGIPSSLQRLVGHSGRWVDRILRDTSSLRIIHSPHHTVLTIVYAEPFPGILGKFWYKDDLRISLVSAKLREEQNWLMWLNLNQRGYGVLSRLNWLGGISGHLWPGGLV